MIIIIANLMPYCIFTVIKILGKKWLQISTLKLSLIVKSNASRDLFTLRTS